MTWRVAGGEGEPTLYAGADEAVDALMIRVRTALDSMSEEELRLLDTEQDLWRSDATTVLLKRYMSSPEGVDGEGESTKNLRVSLGQGYATIEQVFTLDKVMEEFNISDFVDAGPGLPAEDVL